MGTGVSRTNNYEEEVQPVLSDASTAIQSSDSSRVAGYGATANNGTGPCGTGRASTRNYVLKTELRTDGEVMRVPFSYNPVNRNGFMGLSESDEEQYYEEEARRRGFAHRIHYLSRLDPRPDSILAMPDHVVPEDYMVRILVPVRGKQSSIITIFAMWNTMMGTSLLSMPWAIEQAGFVCGISMLMAMALIMFYTSYLVLKSVKLEPDKAFREFSDVCGHFLGRFAKLLATFSSLVTLLGGAIVYWILLSNFLYNIVVFIYSQVHTSTPHNQNSLGSPHQYPSFLDLYANSSHSNSSPSYPDVVCTDNDNSTVSGEGSTFAKVWTEDLFVPLVLSVPLMALVNFRSPTFFTKVNSCGVFSVLYLLIFSIVKASRWGVHLHLGINSSFSDSDPFYSPDFKWTFPALTGIAALAYFLQNCVITITQNQKHPENNVRDLAVAYLLVAASYLIIGCVVYVSFPLAKSCIEDNFLNNMAADDVMTFVAHIMLYFQMTCVFPLLTFVFRVQLLSALFGSEWPSWKHVVVLNLMVFAVCIIFAVFLPHIGRIIGFVGAFCGLAYAIMLPCLVTVVAQYRNGKLTWTSLTVHSLLIIIGAANFISQFLILGKTS